jgi:hypothetical protein
MKETAVQWFALKVMYLKMNPKEVFEFLGWLEQAKEMEKEQIINARIDGDENYTLVGNKRKEYAEQYYKDTYGDE